VKRAVELAVPAAVEAVAIGLTGGGRDRGGPARARELRVGAESVGAGDLADQLRGGQRAVATLCEQLRRVGGNQLCELALEFADAGCARGDLAHEIARHPHSGRLSGDAPAGDAREIGPGSRLVSGASGCGRRGTLRVVDAYLALVSKRDTRRYAERAIPEAVVRCVVEAGRLAGSSRNAGPAAS
jgi:hypothetical protein